MMWKTKTHEFTATLCGKTGKPCPALARLARAIAQALSTAAPATTPDFQFEGSSELTHCTQGCTARFRARADQVRIYCDADDETPIETLNSYADMMFGTTFTSLPAGSIAKAPCAMLEASPLAQRPPLNTDIQVAL